MRTVPCLLMLVICFVGGGCAPDRTPEGSFRALIQAFEDRSRIDVERYLDVERTTENIIDGIVGAAVQAAMAETDTTDPFAAAGAGIAVAMIQGMKPMLSTMVANAVWRSVDPEAVEDVELGEFANGADTVDLREYARTFEGVEYVEVRDEVAFLGVAIRSAEYDTTIVPEFRMERVGDHWRVVGINNVEALMTTINQ